MHRIISNREWGRLTPKTRTALNPRNVDMVTSHTDAVPAPLNEIHSTQRVQGHDRFHSAKWSGGIGYNFLISPFGQIFEGRGFVNRGAHAASVNHRAYGVCFLGDKVTPAAEDAYWWLYDEMCRRAGKQLTRIGHGQLRLESTDCPGALIRLWLSLRRNTSMQSTQQGEDMARIESLSDNAAKQIAAAVITGLSEAGGIARENANVGGTKHKLVTWVVRDLLIEAIALLREIRDALTQKAG